MFPRDRAIIEPNGGNTFTARTTHNNIIAISDSLDVVISRIERAQPNVETVVQFRGKEHTLEQYDDAVAPIIYRVTFGLSEITGNAYVIDRIKNGRHSEIKLYDTLEEVDEHIRSKQGEDSFYFVHIAGKRRLNLENSGMEFYDITRKLADVTRLREALKEERKKRNRELSNENKAI